jgi:ribonuclease BN (tRNA processing enzyme)
VRLNVLGAGPAYTDRQDATGASYLVTHDGTSLLLDLGQGSFPRIFPLVHPTDLDAVVVSHLHPDHFIDLVPLRHYLRYEFEPSRRARVIGPRGHADRLDALHAEPGFSGEALDCEVLGTARRQIGALSLEAAIVAHTDESYAMRVAGADGPGLVYSGDCGRAFDLAPLIRPGDTLLTEVAFGAGPVAPGVLHLDGAAVGELAAATHPERILLTHVLSGRDLAATIASIHRRWDGPVEFVWPGDALDL